MGTRYICDVCGKQYDVRGGFSPTGYPVASELPPDRWAMVFYLAPERKEEPKPGKAGIYPARMPQAFLVCSQVCAEKALDEAKEGLRKAFESA